MVRARIRMPQNRMVRKSMMGGRKQRKEDLRKVYAKDCTALAVNREKWRKVMKKL